MSIGFRLRAIAVVLHVFLLGLPCASAGQAKNVILMIGDGMGPSHFAAARFYSNRLLGKDLQMSQVMQCGRIAILLNDAADTMIPESAGAATQIATGERANWGVASTASDGTTPLPTVLELAKKRGMSTGLVTTSAITDATPAAFVAHVSNRNDQEAIAAQIAQSGVELLLGGGGGFFLSQAQKGDRKDGRNLLEEMRRAGYTVVSNAGELQHAHGAKILGLFHPGWMNFEIDRANTNEPSLAEMTAKALDLLSRNQRGFFLMVEGGRIDHASHMNDAATTIREVLAFDEAVGDALQFQKAHRNTLLIITADHETGGLSLIGHDRDSEEKYVGPNLPAIQSAHASFSAIRRDLGEKPTADRVRAGVKKYLSIEITPEEAETVVEDPIHRLDPWNYSFPQVHTLAFVLRPYLRVGWSAQTHTGSPVFAAGCGPGSEGLSGLRHNTELFRIMQKAAKIPGGRNQANGTNLR